MTGALSYLGLNETSPYELPGNGKSDVGCEVRLSPQSQIDEWLPPYTKDASLELLNKVYEQLGSLSYAKRIETERKIGDNGIDSIHGLSKMIADERTRNEVTQKFFCPIVLPTEIFITQKKMIFLKLYCEISYR